MDHCFDLVSSDLYILDDWMGAEILWRKVRKISSC